MRFSSEALELLQMATEDAEITSSCGTECWNELKDIKVYCIVTQLAPSTSVLLNGSDKLKCTGLRIHISTFSERFCETSFHRRSTWCIYLQMAIWSRTYSMSHAASDTLLHMHWWRSLDWTSNTTILCTKKSIGCYTPSIWTWHIDLSFFSAEPDLSSTIRSRYPGNGTSTAGDSKLWGCSTGTTSAAVRGSKGHTKHNEKHIENHPRNTFRIHLLQSSKKKNKYPQKQIVYDSLLMFHPKKLWQQSMNRS